MTNLVEPQATPDPTATPWVPMWSLNPTGIDLRYQGDYLPGSYTDGDIVVFQGVAYLCVRPTGNAPVPWTPPQQVPTYGTSFPANPVDGQEHVLAGSLGGQPYQWRCRYNAANASGYGKWEFIGGTPWVSAVAGGLSTNLASQWLELTNGPTFVPPRSGLWDVWWSVFSQAAAAGGAYTAYSSLMGSTSGRSWQPSLSGSCGYWSGQIPGTARPAYVAGETVSIQVLINAALQTGFYVGWIRAQPVILS